MAANSPQEENNLLFSENTLLNIRMTPRPRTSSPLSEPPTSPAPIFSPAPDHTPVSPRKPTSAETEELLQFVRETQTQTPGILTDANPTIPWTAKKRPLLPEIRRTGQRDPDQQTGNVPCVQLSDTGSLVASTRSGLSRSLENIPGPNPKLVEQHRLQSSTGKMKVTRLLSLPPIETDQRPSAPSPASREQSSVNLDLEDGRNLYSSNSPVEQP